MFNVPMTHDAVDTAYATLGLRRDASALAVKQQYRTLVRKWHPDQFTSDPQGMAEATLMLKAVNRAYRTIVEHRAPDTVVDASSRNAGASPQPAWVGGHLTQQQRDEIIEAIRHSESLLSIVFDDEVAGRRSRAASVALVLIYAVVGWRYGDSVRVLASSILPLSCIWFPDTLGKHVGGRITKPSPAWLVWLFGWVVLLLPPIAIGIMWLSTP